jgi:hypothetical protein
MLLPAAHSRYKNLNNLKPLFAYASKMTQTSRKNALASFLTPYTEGNRLLEDKENVSSNNDT